MHFLFGFTLLLSLIYVIKTQDDCQIISPRTNEYKTCDFETESRKQSIKKGCKRPNVSFL